MTRSVTFIVVLLLVFAATADVEAQTILAATVPVVWDVSIKPTDVLLVCFTAVLALATWGLWKATRQLAVSTEGLKKSAEIQGKDMQDSLDLARDSLKFASGQLESANAQRAKDLGDQLFEFDKLLVSSPSLQIELEKLRDNIGKFHGMENKECFVKVKSFIYMHLNFFDEIISIYEGKSDDSVEYKDWCNYIIEKMKHPAYKDIMDTEREIFGGRIRQFFEDNRRAIYADNGKAWQW